MKKNSDLKIIKNMKVYIKIIKKKISISYDQFIIQYQLLIFN
jgi:hypothetical protein